MTNAKRLVEDNLNCVRWVIRQYIRVNENTCGLEYDDLYQEGCIALWLAAETYEEGHGVRFRTYAVPVIRNHLVDYCRKVKSRSPPTVPLDSLESRFAETAEDDGRLFVEQVLSYGKRAYSGVAKMGIEAMELKLAGYSGADIAGLYGAKPNEVGAWISRAAKKLKKDLFSDDNDETPYKKVS